MIEMPPSASALGLCLCHGCGLACELQAGSYCPRCGSSLHPRKPAALGRTWALLVAALICYVPANLLPVMQTQMLGQQSESNILSGIVEFWESGAWDIALIIFVASIGVPMAKFIAMGLLLVTVQRQSTWRQRQRARLYRLVELIGYWSMLDVLVVALVSALVKFGLLGDIEPRLGILFFGVTVVLTMLAAMSFDPRLIWDTRKANEYT